MFKALILFLLFQATILFGFDLKEKLCQGQVGSYVITEHNKIYTLLHVHSKIGTTLAIEEISVPSAQAPKENWKDWVKGGAPGHTSWLMYHIDLEQAAITECYSFSHGGFLSLEPNQSFLTTLMQLKLVFLSENERIQKGPSQRAGTIQQEKPWSPPQFKDGKKVIAPQFDVYQGMWPSDQTELSGKQVTLYFDQANPTFPFPYWIQVRDGGMKFKMRVIDSGDFLESPKEKISSATQSESVRVSSSY